MVKDLPTTKININCIRQTNFYDIFLVFHPAALAQAVPVVTKKEKNPKIPPVIKQKRDL